MYTVEGVQVLITAAAYAHTTNSGLLLVLHLGKHIKEVYEC
jgi:hypothetical protein